MRSPRGVSSERAIGQVPLPPIFTVSRGSGVVRDITALEPGILCSLPCSFFSLQDQGSI